MKRALGAIRDVWRAGRNRTIETAAGRVFVEVLSPPMRCFIIGAVHIAQPLAQMLAMADYAVTVIDPRGAFATQAGFPSVELVSEWPDEALDRLRPDRGSAVIALTHDPSSTIRHWPWRCARNAFTSARSARAVTMRRVASG